MDLSFEVSNFPSFQISNSTIDEHYSPAKKRDRIKRETRIYYTLHINISQSFFIIFQSSSSNIKIFKTFRDHVITNVSTLILSSPLSPISHSIKVKSNLEISSRIIYADERKQKRKKYTKLHRQTFLSASPLKSSRWKRKEEGIGEGG